MKRTTNKLKLQTTTIRNLSHEQLSAVAGGGTTVFSCIIVTTNCYPPPTTTPPNLPTTGNTRTLFNC